MTHYFYKKKIPPSSSSELFPLRRHTANQWDFSSSARLLVSEHIHLFRPICFSSRPAEPTCIFNTLTMLSGTQLLFKYTYDFEFRIFLLLVAVSSLTYSSLVITEGRIDGSYLSQEYLYKSEYNHLYLNLNLAS